MASQIPLAKSESSHDARWVTRSLWPQRLRASQEPREKGRSASPWRATWVQRTSGQHRQSLLRMLGGSGCRGAAVWGCPLNEQTIASSSHGRFPVLAQASTFHTPFPAGRQCLRDCLGFNLGPPPPAGWRVTQSLCSSVGVRIQ